MKKNKKEETYKEFLRLNEEYEELQWGSRNEIMYEELDKPIKDGYNVSWGVRDDIARSPIGGKVIALVEEFSRTSWSRTIDFKTKIGKGKFQTIEPYFVNLTSEKLDKFHDWVKDWVTIYQGFKSYTNYWGKEVNYYRVSIPKYYLVRKVSVSYITHREILQPDIESRKNQLYNLLISKKYYKLFRNRGFSDKKSSRILNKSNRRTDKMVNKFNLTNDLEKNFTAKHKQSCSYGYY